MFLTYKELEKSFNKKDIQSYIDKLSNKYKDKAVLFYGAGVLAELLFDQYDLSQFKTIGIADNKFMYEKGEFKNIKTVSPEEIEALTPDVIILTIYDDVQIKRFFKVYYPEIAKIPMEHILPKTLIGKFKSFVFGN